ncbi:MAG: hypothetical protein IJX02_01475 [Clostridia bacterium]|nr:hypothetical protein [Clostridia bacterium]
MEYIFFDIECANCFHGRGKICSFGYVITDEQFNIISKNDILMNPHSRFHLCGHGNHPGITLGYDEKTFNKSPDFPKHYKKIKELLTKPDRLVFGFSVMSDAGYIKSECERFHRELFDYSFIDIQRIYTDYKGLDNTPSLIKCAHEYGVDDTQDVHRSDDDSYFTMRVLKGLCEETGLSATELIEKYPHCKCWCKGGELGSEFLKYKELLKAQKLTKMEKLTGSPRANWVHSSEKNAEELSTYIKRVFVTRSSPSPLCGKKVCISSLYEEYHFNEMMNIISLLASIGAKYTRHAYSCDYFVEHSIVDKHGKEYCCYRREKAQLINDTEREITFIPLDTLLCLLNTDEKNISALDRSKLTPTRRGTNKPFFRKQKITNV